MWRTRRYAKGISLLIITLMFLLGACSSGEKFIGVYKSEPNSSTGYPEVYLELKKDGEGLRRVRGEAFAFKWNMKGDEIRIYTQSGGIIVGRLEGKDTLVVRLPGPKIVHLKKIK